MPYGVTLCVMPMKPLTVWPLVGETIWTHRRLPAASASGVAAKNGTASVTIVSATKSFRQRPRALESCTVGFPPEMWLPRVDLCELALSAGLPPAHRRTMTGVSLGSCDPAYPAAVTPRGP